MALKIFLVALIVVFNLCAARVHADDIDYVYDEAGRLVQATNRTSGEAVRYTYDAVGNITSQVSSPIGALAIGHFSPRRGPAGAQVTINGTGFSATPAANTVRFNGVQAAIVSSSQTRIVATVPAAAASGPINVQVGATSALSAEIFTVTATGDDPAIVTVLPNMTWAGNLVTIVGMNFEAATSQNRVRFNNTLAEVLEATPTAIVARVPVGAGSGKIKVTTPRGIAVSPLDFVVLPTNYAPDRIDPPQRMTLDGAGTNLEFGAVPKVATRLFEAAAGDLLTIGVSNLSFAGAWVSVFDPENELVAARYMDAASPGMQLPVLKLSGAYTIFVDSGLTGTMTLNILKPSVTAIAIDGGPATIAIEPPGRRALVTFTAVANTYPHLAISDVTLAGATYSLLQPNGTLLKSGLLDANGLQLRPLLQQAGSYQLLIDPAGSIAGSATVAVSSTPPPSLSANGSTLELELDNANPVNLPFQGLAGSYMSIGVAIDADNWFGMNITVLGPDGSPVVYRGIGTGYLENGRARGSGVVNFGPLQQGGTFTAVVQGDGTVADVSLTLSRAAEGSTQHSHIVNVPRPGQSGLHSFSADAGQFLSIAVVEEHGRMHGATATVLKPDGTELFTQTFTIPAGDGGVIGGGQPNQRHGSAVLNMGPLPMTGEYRLLLQQIDAVRREDEITGEWRLILSQPINGGAAEQQLNVTGQGVLYRFEGVIGEHFSVGLSSNDGWIDAVGVTVLDPDNSAIATGGMLINHTGGGSPGLATRYGSGVVNVGPLSASGTYTIFVQQLGYQVENIGTLKTTVSRPMSSGLVANGAPVEFETDREGQGVLESFTGVVGQYRSVRVSTAWHITDGTIKVVAPDGSTLGSVDLVMKNLDTGGGGVTLEQGFVGHGYLSVGPLPAAGTYKVLVEQRGAGRSNTGTFKLQLSAPVAGTLNNNATTAVSMPVPGQGLQYTFSANAGTYRAVVVSQSAGPIPAAVVSVLGPNGAILATAPFYPSANPISEDMYQYSGKVLLNAGPMPTTGTYSVVVQPIAYQRLAGAANLSVTLTQPLQGAVSASPVAIGMQGQGLLRTFSGTAGQHVSVQVSETNSGISSADVALLAPQGAVLKRAQLNPTDNGGNYSGSMTLLGGLLPVTGTYSVLVQQTSLNTTGTGQLTIGVATLTAGTGSSANVTSTVPGQIVTRTFTAAAGQSFTAALTSVTLAPDPEASYYIQLYLPDGSPAVESAYCSGGGPGCQLAMRNLPQTGIYQLQIQPQAAVTINAVLTIAPALTGALTVNTPLSANLNTTGRAAHLTFATTVRQNWALSLSSFSTSPADVAVTTMVINSSGAAVYSGATISSYTINLHDLPADTYFVWIVPQSPATSTMQVTLRGNVSSAAPVNSAPASFSTTSPGQHRYFTFAGQAGQSVTVALSDVVVLPATSGTFGIQVARPNGELLIDQAYCDTTVNRCRLPLRNLPDTGTYTVTVVPFGLFAVNGKINVAVALAATLAANVPSNLNLGVLGQAAHLSFTAAVGQHFSIDIGSIATVPANTVLTVHLFNSAGALLPQSGQVLTGSNLTLNLANLAPGDYFVWLVPQYSATSTLQVTLKSVALLPIDGTPAPFTIASVGQQQWYTFAAEIGDHVTVALSDVTLSPDPQASYYIQVLAPSGSQMLEGTAYCSGWQPQGCRLALRNLPERGIYRVLVEPLGATMSATLTIASALTGVLNVGTPLPLNLDLPARAAHLRFTATAGQYLSLDVDALSTVPADTLVNVWIYRSISAWPILSATALTGATINLPNLVADTYFVWVVPQYAATGTLQVILRSTPMATADGPVIPFNTTSFGQQRNVTFTANAGDDINLAVTGVTLTPTATADYYLHVFDPQGAQWNGAYCSGSQPAGCQFPLQDLPLSGVYSVLIEPAAGVTISGTLGVSAIP